MDDETSEEESTTVRQSNLLKRHSNGSSDLQALELPADESKHPVAESKLYVPQSKILVRSTIDEYKLCHEDPDVVQRLAMDKYRQELPGPWSHQYIHVSAAHDTPWKPIVITAMGIAIIFVIGLAVYFYKKYYRFKKSPLVLPPGLADIVEKPHHNGKGVGVTSNGGHGTGLVVTPDSISSNLHGHLNGLQGEDDEEATYEGTNSSLSGKETFDARTVPVGHSVADSETSSLHEQVQSLLEDRMDTHSASSIEQHEESVGEDEEEEELKKRGMPIIRHNPHLQQDVMIAAVPPTNKPIQQPVMQQTVIKPGTNGYVTIAQVRKYLHLL